MKRPPGHASKVAEQRGAPGRSRAAPSGVGRLLALARRAGNQALERLLGRPQPAHPSQPAVTRLGAALGADVSGVRVVDDTDSHAVAASLNAAAVAAGGMVLLGEQAPPLSSPAGERLLAHELAHVAQQRAAGDRLRDAVSEPGDTHERAADAAAARAVSGEAANAGSVHAAGAPAAVQRQTLAIRKQATIPRAEAQQRIEQYLERVRQLQGMKTVSMTDEVKNTLRRIFLNDVQGLLRFEGFLGRTVFPGEPKDLAAAIAPFLPEEITPDRLAHLDVSARPPHTTAAGRVGTLVQKTAPYVSPETQQQQWEFDRMAKEARQKDTGVVGPYGVDLQRAVNVARGLGAAIAGPKEKRPPAEESAANPALAGAIEGIDRTALVPAEALGTAKADAFADAQEVARALAGDLDRAQAAAGETVTLRLGPNYNGVKDRERIIGEVGRIVRLVRDALPHKASRVRFVDLYLGERLVRRIPLAVEKSE